LADRDEVVLFVGRVDPGIVRQSWFSTDPLRSFRSVKKTYQNGEIREMRALLQAVGASLISES